MTRLIPVRRKPRHDITRREEEDNGPTAARRKAEPTHPTPERHAAAQPVSGRNNGLLTRRSRLAQNFANTLSVERP
jgi:hypothetical protein